MSYRVQEETWIQRHSRLMMTVLAGLGLLITAYLTVLKVTGTESAFCTGEGGCNLVLASRWAEIFGFPTAALGLLGFLTVLVLVVVPETLSPLVKQWRWPALFAVVSAMFTFEMYMAYVMAVELQQACLFCITAIVLVTGLFGLTLLGHRWVDRVQLIVTFVILSLVTWAATLGVYAKQPDPIAAGLADHLHSIEGTMYGAYWCPHCEEQKAEFGPAFSRVPYVECSPNGPGTPQTPECTEKGIESYPTWIINGEVIRGRQSLEDLAEVAGYELSGNT